MSFYTNNKVIIRKVVTMPVCVSREIYWIGRIIHLGIICREEICISADVSRWLIGFLFLGQTLFFEF